MVAKMIGAVTDRFATATDLVRKRHWTLFAAKTLRTLRLGVALRRMTCAIHIPYESTTRGLRLHVELGDWISDDICRYGVWEPDLTRSIITHARRGGVLIDVGANLGYFSLLWAVARADNRVYAIEPSPRIFAKLTRNVRLNRLEDRVRACEIALSDRDGRGCFSPGPVEQTGWGGLTDAPAPDTIEVQIARFDSLFASHSYIDVLKIDAEGCDTRVLHGAERMLRERRIGAVYYEQFADRMADLGIDAGEAAVLLKGCGYAVSCLNQADDGRVSEWQALAG
jgi:FkbM family methyltransferase